MPLDYEALKAHIDDQLIKPFYRKRTEKLAELKLDLILKRKNPYLFKAKNLQTAGEMASEILNAHLSSQEETIFGNLLEELAIHINFSVYGGSKAEENVWKSIDLIFDRDGKRYLVGIKSGPNWGNADQQAAMRSNFKKARAQVLASGWSGEIVCVNGVMYGQDASPLKQDKDPEKVFFKYCGQDFWSLISGDDNLYKTIIKPLDKKAKERDDEFRKLVTTTTNRLTRELLERFSKNDELDWDSIVDFVSKRKRTEKPEF